MGTQAQLPEEVRALAAEVVRRWGGHPARRWGLILSRDDDDALAGWLIAACLLDRRTGEARAADAFARLAKRGWDRPTALAQAEVEDVSSELEASQVPKPELVAALLLRVTRSLGERGGSALAECARGSATLEELGGGLSQIAAGFGRAAIVRFLQPLRDVWPAAGELPLDAAARAAAVHVGLLDEGQDEDGEPAVLRARLRDTATDLVDVEAALGRLGRLACLRGRWERCPLGAGCPARPGD